MKYIDIPYNQRLSKAIEHICRELPPQHLVDDWVSGKSDELQDWVGGTEAPLWVQSIAIIDAAIAMAEHPCDGENVNS